MVPVVTGLIADSTYFGIYDMSNTVVSFASAIAVMGMYDAMYYMFFEKENIKISENPYKSRIFAVSLCRFVA